MIDCGREDIKGVTEFNGELKTVYIPSVVGEYRIRDISEGGDYEVEISTIGKRFVGSLAINESKNNTRMRTSTKIHEETKILVLTAIHQLYHSPGRIRLITGLPVRQHKQVIKERLKKLISGNYSVTVNGIKKNIVIDDEMLIGIEGAGAYFSEVFREHPELFEQKCRVLDIGSRTINGLVIDKEGVFIDRDSFTENFGCSDITNDEEITSDDKMSFVRRILGATSSHWISGKHNEPLLLSGGGVRLLSDELKEVFPEALFVGEPIFSNAIGWLEMAKRIR